MKVRKYIIGALIWLVVLFVLGYVAFTWRSLGG